MYRRRNLDLYINDFWKKFAYKHILHVRKGLNQSQIEDMIILPSMIEISELFSKVS